MLYCNDLYCDGGGGELKKKKKIHNFRRVGSVRLSSPHRRERTKFESKLERRKEKRPQSIKQNKKKKKTTRWCGCGVVYFLPSLLQWTKEKKLFTFLLLLCHSMMRPQPLHHHWRRLWLIWFSSSKWWVGCQNDAKRRPSSSDHFERPTWHPSTVDPCTSCTGCQFATLGVAVFFVTFFFLLPPPLLHLLPFYDEIPLVQSPNCN